MRHFLSAITLSGALLFSAAAHADTISFTVNTPIDLSPSADTLSFDASTQNFTATTGGPTTTVFQSGLYIAGDSDTLTQVIPFSFQETVTVDGISKLLTFTGTDNVTYTENIITLDYLGYEQFGAIGLDFLGTRQIVTDHSPQNFDMSVVLGAVPEPSSLALCGTGILALAGVARRKFQNV